MKEWAKGKVKFYNELAAKKSFLRGDTPLRKRYHEALEKKTKLDKALTSINKDKVTPVDEISKVQRESEVAKQNLKSLWEEVFSENTESRRKRDQFQSLVSTILLTA